MAMRSLLLVAGLLAHCAAIQPRSPPSALPADAPESSVVKAIDFDRRLVVCNAYPSSSPMLVQVNGDEATEGRSIDFGECRSVDSRVQSGDRLDLVLRDEGLHSTFEIDTIPPSDAELVLVPHKRKESPMIRFQSLAMPIRADGKDAQLALVDTFAGNSSRPSLRMEDHIVQTYIIKDGKKFEEPQTKTKRAEDLSFDRVYSVEAGLYDAAMDDTPAKPVNLLQDQNYIMIRAGGGASNFPESLMVFPDTPMPPPPAPKSGSCAIGMPLMAILAFACVVLP
jgi:hypothetical protein